METTMYFWDCECEEDYIHSKRQKECIYCNTKREDQPDSRTEEVIKFLLNNEKEIRNFIISADTRTLNGEF